MMTIKKQVSLIIVITLFLGTFSLEAMLKRKRRDSNNDDNATYHRIPTQVLGVKRQHSQDSGESESSRARMGRQENFNNACLRLQRLAAAQSRQQGGQLVTLDLTGDPITDAVLDVILNKFQTIQTIHIRDCWSLSPLKIQQLIDSDYQVTW